MVLFHTKNSNKMQTSKQQQLSGTECTKICYNHELKKNPITETKAVLFCVVSRFLRKPVFRSVFNYFILSLSVSDLMSALISPLYLYKRTWGFEYWNIPKIFCQVRLPYISLQC